VGAAAGGAPGGARRAGPGEVSGSWARLLCTWSDLLPEDTRADADVILLGAAAAGADLDVLSGLAEEIRRRTAPADGDGDDGFGGRRVFLETTFGGAGRLGGDLAPGGAAALGAGLDALGKRAGPADLRTKGQRQHDALEEACRRQIAVDERYGYNAATAKA
jgi:hypothetical protein